MSEIPYYFDHTPQDFRKLGWFKNPYCVAFVSWAFARCSRESRRICHDGKLIDLDPYEFVFGRSICSQETGLTDRQVRVQQKHMVDAGYLKKTTSKTTNKYSVYKWVTTSFSQINNQQNDQQTTSRRPADDHNQDIKSSIYKDPPPQTPPTSEKGRGGIPKEIKRIMDAVQEKEMPFSEADIFMAYQQTSGLALQEAINEYRRRKTTAKALDYPSAWLLKQSKKHFEYELAKRKEKI